MRRTNFFPLFFFFLLLFPHELFAYTYMKGNPRWSFSSMPIPWYVTYTKTSDWGGRDLKTIQKMVEDAFDVWEKVQCSFIMFRYMGTTKVGAVKGDGKNVIEWTATLPGNVPPSAVGLGGPIWSNGIIKEGNVWLKSGTRSDQAEMLILAHEIGHALGFGHTTTPNAIMYPAYNRSTHFTEDDRQLICNAYPISQNTCSEDAHCPKGLICNGGRCQKCHSDGDCRANHYCDRGLCMPNCHSDAECLPKGRICVNDKCTSCKKDEDCGEGKFCELELCHKKCQSDSDCPAEMECKPNGRCLKRGACTSNKECKKGEYCQNHVCVSAGSLGKLCQGMNDCATGQDCLVQDCQVDLDCHEGYVCDKTSRSCVKKGTQDKASVCGIPCKASSSCPENFVCKEYGSSRSFCFPARRKPAPPKKEKEDTQPKEGAGCACSTNSTAAAPPFFMFVLLFGWMGLFFLGPHRRRHWLSLMLLRLKK